jgi:hypothetical protein
VAQVVAVSRHSTLPGAAIGDSIEAIFINKKGVIMSCDSKNHQMHMCALKAQGLDDCIKSLSDNPTVECRKCGAMANSSKNLCAAHLGDWAPNVEGGHGSVGLEEVGKKHEG